MNPKLFTYRIQWASVLIVLCFLSVLSLRSQSAASYPTYFLALLTLATVYHWRDVFETGLLIWVLLLLAWLGASTFWSTPFIAGDAASMLVRCVLVFCFVVSFAECQMREQLQRWLGTALLAVGGIAVLAAMVNFVVTNPADGRLNGLGQLDTHVVAALVFGVVMLFGLHCLLRAEEHVALRVLAGVVVGLCAGAVYLSDSRNAMACVLLGAFVLVAAHRVRDRLRFCALLGLFVTLGISFLFIAYHSEVLADLVFPRGDSFRLVVWQRTLEALSHNWLFGLGINTPDGVDVGEFVAMHPHNMYLAVLFQGGLIALALYVVVLVRSTYILLKHYDKRDAKLALSILALSLPSHLLDGHELVDKVSDTWFLVWLPVAIAVGISWRYNEAVPLDE